MKRVIWIYVYTPTVLWLGGGTISPSYWMYMGLLTLGRQKYTQQCHKCLSHVSLILGWLLKSQKDTNNQVLIKSQQNWLKQGVEQFSLRSIIIFILFGMRRNCVRSGRNRSLYLFLRRVVTQIVVIIEKYHFCQLRTKVYPTSRCQG
jgi:hypothetical protein